MRKTAFVAVALLTLAPLMALPAEAVEYRLRVASMWENALVSFLGPGDVRDGASGPGLDKLEARLDSGDFPRGALLYDRHLQAASEDTARQFGTVTVRGTVTLGGGAAQAWDEVRWEGKPGERSVWVVEPSGRQAQEIVRVAVRGTGPMRHFQVYTLPPGTVPFTVMRMPLGFLRYEGERGRLHGKYLAPRLDLGEGIGIVVGANDDGFFADRVWVVVNHTAEPTTFKAALAWLQRRGDKDAPTQPEIIRMRFVR
jgi:hypothetical protein